VSQVTQGGGADAARSNKTAGADRQAACHNLIDRLPSLNLDGRSG
jgi:hypothetical protein